MTEDDIPQSVDQLQRALERGECFVWQHSNRRMYFEFVEEVGPIRTETDADGHDPHTTGASVDEMAAVLRYGSIKPVDADDIPVLEADV